MDQKRTTELLNFMHKALSNNLTVAGPCRYIAAAFMVPRSEPNKPYRVRKFYKKNFFFSQKFQIFRIFYTNIFNFRFLVRHLLQASEPGYRTF